MLKPIVIVSIFISTFYLLPMFTNKKELFLSLVKEFQKLKNLEAQYPELKADFNAIAPAHEVEKIGDFLAKQKAKIMAKEAAVGAVQSETMMEEESGDTEMVNKSIILDGLFNEWKDKQYNLLSEYQNQSYSINIEGVKLAIQSNFALIKDFNLLIEINKNISSIVGQDNNQNIGELSKKIQAYLLDPKFTKTMKTWFDENNKKYKATTINTLKGKFLDLAGAIGKAVEVASKFKLWREANLNSLDKINDAGRVSLTILSNKLDAFYGNDCPSLFRTYLEGLDLDKGYIIGKEAKMYFNQVLNANIKQEIQDAICYSYDSLGTGLIGTFVSTSIINNDKYEKIETLIKNSIQVARGTLATLNNAEDKQLIVDMDKLKPIIEKDLGLCDNWTQNVISISIEELLYSKSNPYKIYSQCSLELDNGFSAVLNKLDDLIVSCDKVPQDIPFLRIVTSIQNNQIEIVPSHIVIAHKNWHSKNWHTLSSLKFDSEAKLNVKTLKDGFTECFSNPLVDSNLIKAWLDTMLNDIIADEGKDYILWEDIKGKVFTATPSDKILNSLKTIMNANVLANKEYDYFQNLCKNWENYMPSQSVLAAVVQQARAYYNVKINAKELANNSISFTLNNDFYKISLPINIKFKSELYYDANNQTTITRLKHTSIVADTLAFSTEHLKSQLTLSNLSLHSISVVEENVSILSDSIHNTIKIRLKFKCERSTVNTVSKTPAVGGGSLGFSIFGISVGVNRTEQYETKGYDVYSASTFYIEDDVIIYLKTDLAYKAISFIFNENRQLINNGLEIKLEDKKINLSFK